MPAGCRKPQYLLHPARYLGHLCLESSYSILNFLAHTYHSYLVLYLQKIDTAPAQEMTRKLVMQKLTISRIIKHHLKPVPYLSHWIDLHLHPATVDYSTQGDPNPAAPQNEHIPKEFHGTNNHFIPEGSDHCIHDIQKKTFLPGHLENRNNAYLVELPDLKEMLRMERFLMDEMSGQFYAIYGNSYQHMSTHPRLDAPWEKAELLDELAETRCAFGYTGLPGPILAQQIPQPAHQQPTPQVPTEDIIPGLTPSKTPPWSISYQLPAFSLDRPTARLMMEQRMQVYHNYISAVSNLKHKKDIINRLKRVEPHNIPTYEAKMTHHIALHEDVLRRLLTNLKQDNYFRSLEDLSTIDGLQAYDDVRLFPELYDTTAVIDQITSEIDLIDRQLKRPGMYPLPPTPLPSVSGFVPRSSSTFKPIPPKGQPTVTSPQSSDQPQKDDSIGPSPGSSLPCGQGMPQDPPSSINESPSWSPQHSPQQVLPQPNPPPTTPSSESQINPSAKLFIPAAVTPQNVPSSPQQSIPKSTNGEGVKCSRQKGNSNGQDE